MAGKSGIPGGFGEGSQARIRCNPGVGSQTCSGCVPQSPPGFPVSRIPVSVGALRVLGPGFIRHIPAWSCSHLRGRRGHGCDPAAFGWDRRSRIFQPQPFQRFGECFSMLALLGASRGSENPGKDPQGSNSRPCEDDPTSPDPAVGVVQLLPELWGRDRFPGNPAPALPFP